MVLDCDLPEHDLRKGDLGAVVQVYEPDGLEVEFVTASCCTDRTFSRSPAMTETTRLLRDLVRIPSVNPMGREQFIAARNRETATGGNIAAVTANRQQSGVWRSQQSARRT